MIGSGTQQALVLCTVGQRFEGAIRQSDTLARLGGDEFAVILPRLDGAATAMRVAERLTAALEAPMELRGESVKIGASIGIATYPKHAVSADPLLAAADAAMYQAKRAGSDRIASAQHSSGSVVTLQPLRWSAAHAIGVRAIDDQHGHMAQLIEAVSVLLKDAAEPDAIAAQLNELISFTEFHFASEERLMAAHHVANAAAHRDAHRRLLDDIRNLRIERDLPSISLILRYLQEWLVRHVDGLDKELGEALMSLGCS
jgi:hemerythrin-like metal-binding protein